MTSAERLLLLTLADTLLVVLRRIGSTVPTHQIEAARHAVDDEAFQRRRRRMVFHVKQRS